ncbi:unnamed protein product [Moneuplotes crassus]|uniref:Uncharacterized protein n=1 Tax=Euplotes crassus TaxID=5936 RepID=A0AAD1UQ32_EUPCR|nr:unnamed protein product [Moneuplotes crassus]
MEKSTTLLTVDQELINKIRQIQKAIYHEEHKLHQEIATSLTISNPMGYSKKRHILFLTSIPTSKTYPSIDPPIRPLCSMQQGRRVGLYFSKNTHNKNRTILENLKTSKIDKLSISNYGNSRCVTTIPKVFRSITRSLCTFSGTMVLFKLTISSS